MNENQTTAPTTKRPWTHKVAKKQRGMNGEWFAYRTAFTGSKEECIAYAREFAAEQREAGVRTTRICVESRRGKRLVFEARVNVFSPSGDDNTEIEW